MAEGRFDSFVRLIEGFILEQENKNAAQKPERDLRLMGRFLKTKDDGKLNIFQPLS